MPGYLVMLTCKGLSQMEAVYSLDLPVLIPCTAEFRILLINSQRHIIQLFRDKLSKVDTRDAATNNDDTNGP